MRDSKKRERDGGWGENITRLFAFSRPLPNPRLWLQIKQGRLNKRKRASLRQLALIRRLHCWLILTFSRKIAKILSHHPLRPSELCDKESLITTDRPPWELALIISTSARAFLPRSHPTPAGRYVALTNARREVCTDIGARLLGNLPPTRLKSFRGWKNTRPAVLL